MRLDELPRSDRIEDRRGGGAGIPMGRAGGLGIGSGRSVSTRAF
jgi:hypothetical protein